MIWGTGKPTGQPDIGASLLFHFRFDEFSDMYLPDFVHKEKRGICFLPEFRVSTPYQSNKSFHAVSLRHSITFLDWLFALIIRNEDSVEI